MSLRTLKKFTSKTEVCSKSWLILKHTHESSQALLSAYEIARAFRGVKQDQKTGKKTIPRLRGMSTDEEQDLLRAMLVTAASGLDSMTKQLIRDSMPILIKIDKRASEELEKFVQRRLKRIAEDQDSPEVSRFLAHILVAPNTQGQIIEDYIESLTQRSLQSVEELSSVINALGFERKTIGIDPGKMKPIFDIRNKIIHELDINWDAKRRNRNIRGEPQMVKHTNALMDLAERILKAVDDKIKDGFKV